MGDTCAGIMCMYLVICVHTLTPIHVFIPFFAPSWPLQNFSQPPPRVSFHLSKNTMVVAKVKTLEQLIVFGILLMVFVPAGAFSKESSAFSESVPKPEKSLIMP